MTGRYLVDSDVLVPFLNGDPAIVERVSTLSCFLSVVVLGELRFGAANSGRVESNQERVNRLEAAMPVLGIDEHTARTYGSLRAELKRKGRPIPKNDLWIAAQAIQYGISLLAFDQHYDHVDGLKIVRP